MKTLSIMQPWAHLIIHHGKDVENRTWRTEERGPILIHAGKKLDKHAFENLKDKYNLPEDLPLGGIVGAVEITDCVDSMECRSVWNANAGYCFVLANAIELPFKQWPGALKFFDVPVPASARDKVIEIIRSKA